MKTDTRDLMKYLMAAISALALVGCGGAGHDDHDDHDGPGHEDTAPAAPTNRIDIPASVRSNLGISFVKAERRQVQQTLRVPGRFEYLPSARRDYRTPMPGRVELLVDQFDRVQEGALLYRIDSPSWRQLQQQIAEADAQIVQLTAQLDTSGPLLAAHLEHEQSLVRLVEIWTARVERLNKLNEAGGGRVNELTEANSALSTTRADLAEVKEKKAQLQAEQQQARAGVRSADARKRFLLDTAAAVTSLSRSELMQTQEVDGRDVPRWAQIDTIAVRADIAGVVAALGTTNGAWADETSSVLTVTQPDRLRFRASGLQSDLGALRDGLAARIVPPTPTATGRSIPISESMQGELMLGLEGEPNDRSIDLFVIPQSLQDWARPGVSAQLEVVTGGSSQPELAIPLAAVQRDGLVPVIFRRAPDNPNQVIRLEADLGTDDGRWVELLSGLAEGDEVVLDGAFQLMLSSSGTIQKGGHFHADGTFHEEEH